MRLRPAPMKILYALASLAAFLAAPATAQIDLSQAKWIGEPPYAPETEGLRIGYRSETFQRQDEYLWVQLDLGEDRRLDMIRIHPARPSGEPGSPGALMPRSFKIYTDRNERFDKTYMRLAEKDDIAPDIGAPVEIQLSAYKLRFIRLVATKLAPVEGGGYAFALGEIELLDAGLPISQHAKVTAQSSVEGGGWTRLAVADGQLFAKDATVLRAQRTNPEPAVQLRREFTLPAKPSRAMLHVATRGTARTRINGAEVPGSGLGSGFVDATSAVVSSFDVTAMLSAGPNALAAAIAPGFVSGRGLLAPLAVQPAIGLGLDQLPRYLAQLDVEFDGKPPLRIVTDGKWTWSQAGAVRSADLFDGESDNAYAHMNGWDKPGVDETCWNKVAAEDASGCVQLVRRAPLGALRRTVQAQLLYTPQPGMWVYDFGETLAGWVSLRFQSQPNMRMTLRHAPGIDVDGRPVPLQGDGAVDRLLGMVRAPDVFEPRFALHRFRCVQLSALENYQPVSPSPQEEVVAQVCDYAPIALGEFKHADGSVAAIADELARRDHPLFDEVRRWLLRRHCGVDLPDGGSGPWLVALPDAASGSVAWTQEGKAGAWSWQRTGGPAAECSVEIPEGVEAALAVPQGFTGFELDGMRAELVGAAAGPVRVSLAPGAHTIKFLR